MRCAVFLVSLVLVGYAAGSLHVIVMGDWGGQASSPYTTPGELNVAKAMEAIAAKLGSNSVLALGDNLYDMGVKNEYDKRFTETFENVYTGATLLNSTFHVLAGNHDHYGNVTGEVEYTKHSKRWSFPSLYYTWTETVTVSGRTASTVTVQFVMIDTVLLAGNTDNSPTAQPPGPEDPQKADDEWTWIDSTLKASTADYLIVAGHYPVWSMAEHGPTGILVSKLKPMFEKYNVTTYLCGHDHNEQYINEGTTVDYHVIGAAHLCDPSTAHSSSIPKDSLKFHFASGTGGFASLTVDSAGLTVIHYDDKGVVQYTTPPHPPRSK